MNYRWFLTLLAKAGDKIPAIIALVQDIAADVARLVELVKSLNIESNGTAGGFTLPLTAPEETPVLEPTEEELAAEAQVLALIAPETDDTLAIRDGSRLREIFQLLKKAGPALETIVPLLIQYGPLIAGLLGKK